MKKTKTKTKKKPWKEHYWFTIGRHLLSRTFFLNYISLQKEPNYVYHGPH